MLLFEIFFLIPLADNLGVLFGEEVHAAFHAKAADLFGGCSRANGDIAGRWLNLDGAVFVDQNVVFEIGLKSITDGAKVAELAAFARLLYRQEAIAVRWQGGLEIL